MGQPLRGRVRFGTFEADLHASELWRDGLKVRIQELPFQLLVSLLERPGEVITREELQKTLWPADTFVDFEQGLNKAINKLREALRDDANNPRFVETLARRGYRLIAPVDRRRLEQAADAPHPAAPAALPPKRVLRRKHWPLALTGLLALLALTGLVWLVMHRPPSSRLEPKPRSLTANPAGNPATDPDISPDGKYLAYDDQAGIHLQAIDTGETRTIPQPESLAHDATGWLPVGWFPDGTRLLAEAMSLVAEHSSLWVISMLGGAPREIHEGGFAWSLSPDGSLIAFTSAFGAPDIWLMGANGEDARKIVAAGEDERLIRVVWSPDSRRIAYARLRSEPAGPQCSIESCDLKGGQPVVVLSDPKLEAGFREASGG